MVVSTKGNGKMGRLVVRAGFGTPTETPTRATGYKIRQTGMASICMLTVLSISAIGRTMCNMVGVRRLGPMARDLKVITKRAGNMDREFITGPMALVSMEDGPITKLMGMETTRGLMGASSKETGKTTICMEEESIHGLMAAATKVIMKTTKNMAKAFILGVTVDSMTVSG